MYGSARPQKQSLLKLLLFYTLFSCGHIVRRLYVDWRPTSFYIGIADAVNNGPCLCALNGHCLRSMSVYIHWVTWVVSDSGRGDYFLHNETNIGLQMRRLTILISARRSTLRGLYTLSIYVRHVQRIVAKRLNIL